MEIQHEGLIKRILCNSKFAVTLTIISAAVAFSLSLVALLSSAEQRQLQDYEVIILNTSTILQNAVKVESLAASTARAVPPLITNTPRPVFDERQLTLPFVTLPGVSQISSFFGSVGSDLTPAATRVPGSTDGGSLIGDFESFVEDVFGNVMTAAADEVVKVVNTLIGDLVHALGVQDWYALYVTELCSGTYEPSFDAPGAKRNATSCTQLSLSSPASGDLSSAISQTNSTLKLGNTVLDFSALNIPNKLGKAGGQLGTVIEAIIVLQIIGTVCTGILIVLATLSMFFAFFKRRWLQFIIGALALLASSCYIVVAIAETGIRIVVETVVYDGFADLGIEAYGGDKLLAVLWIESVFMGLSTVVWALKWFHGRYVRREKEVVPSEKRPVVPTAQINYIEGVTTPRSGEVPMLRRSRSQLGTEAQGVVAR